MINIYTDGACEPNPGQGAWSFVVYDGDVEIYHETGFGAETTNNIMEMTGALNALFWANQNYLSKQVKIHCDSAYVVNGVNDWRHKWKAMGWKRKKNAELANSQLWQEIGAAHDLFPCHVVWVKGHAGIVGNERADELASKAAMIADQEPSDILEKFNLDLDRQFSRVMAQSA